MKLKTLILTCMTTVGLTACASTHPTDRVQSDEFNHIIYGAHLADEYKELSAYEAQEMKDWKDAKYYAKKGLDAAAGENVRPTTLDERDIPEFAVSDLEKAGKKLDYKLNHKHTPDNWDALAKAQAKYDCWTEQQEENIQPNHIEECQVDFYEAIKKVGGSPIKSEDSYRIYFDYNDTALDSDAQFATDVLISRMQENDALKAYIYGFTDTSGQSDYNESLSLARAQAVKTALLDAGIAKKRIRVIGKGETKLLVRTGDGVKERLNRRVDVLVTGH